MKITGSIRNILLFSLLILMLLSSCIGFRTDIRGAVELYLDQWARNNKSPYEIHKFDVVKFGDKDVIAHVVVLIDDPNAGPLSTGFMTPREFIFRVYKIGDEWIAEPELEEFWPFDVKVLYMERNSSSCIEKMSPELDDKICLEITNNGHFDWKFSYRKLRFRGIGSYLGGNYYIYEDLEIESKPDSILFRTFVEYEWLSSLDGTPFGIHDDDMFLFSIPSP